MAEELALEPVPGLRIVWDRGSIGAFARGEGERAWRFDATPEEGAESVRILTAAGPEGGILLIAGARDPNAPGHDAEQVAGLISGADDEVHSIEEAMISTEYDGDGRVRRIGLEVHMPDEDYPLRAAGDRIDGNPPDEEDPTIASVQLAFRLDGQHGSARLDVVGPEE